MFKTALWFFLAGILVAVTIECLWRMVGYYGPNGYLVERLARFLWPSSIFKMVLDKKESELQILLVYSLSFLLNGVLYGLLGLLLAFAKNILSRLRL